MNSDKLSVIFFNLFIISFPLSVTASQSFAILSAFLFLYSSYSSKNLLITLRNRAFIASIAIYIALLPSFFSNIFQYETSLIGILTKSEISDFWMCYAVLPAFYHIRNSNYRTSILRSVYIAAFLIVLTGCLTIFTPFRLASYLTAGFQVREGVRLQHFAGDLWGRFTYLPIGLMNTHLTFGGLCGLIFPGLVFHLSLTFKERTIWKNLVLVLFSILFIIVLFYNQSRSIWLGILFTFGLILIKLSQNLEIKIGKLHWKYLVLFASVLIFLAVTSLNIYKKNWLLQRAFQEVFADNTTENQRYFIYKNTLAMIKNHWFLGVGTGRFDLEHKKESNRMIEENEQIWYELFITPRQHAHHDLFHFYSIGGIFGLLAFLHFWFYLFRLFIKNPLTSQTVLFAGVLVIFVAGFFQCYLLDDEVALPFFAMIGLFAGSLQKEDPRTRAIAGIRNRKEINPNDSFQVESISIGSSFIFLKRQMALRGKNFPLEKFNLYTLIVLILPIVLSLEYIFYKTRLEPMQVYKRKVTVGYPEDRKLIFKALKGESVLYPTLHMKENDRIKIEGCLSHRFTNPITIRKNPFQLAMKLLDNAKNPPNTVRINVIERDAFDQDRLYKVHQSKVIGNEFAFPIARTGKSLILLEDNTLYSSLIDAKQFPENIYFRDFEFKFEGFDSSKEYFDLPAIDFGRLCDAK